MQNQRQSIISATSKKISNSMRSFFNDSNDTLGAKKLLHSQPLAQRRYFLSRAVRDHLWVNLQLLPMTKAGYPVNANGKIQAIDKDRFKLISGNLVYFFNFHQVNYISRLTI